MDDVPNGRKCFYGMKAKNWDPVLLTEHFTFFRFVGILGHNLNSNWITFILIKKKIKSAIHNREQIFALRIYGHGENVTMLTLRLTDNPWKLNEQRTVMETAHIEENVNFNGVSGHRTHSLVAFHVLPFLMNYHRFEPHASHYLVSVHSLHNWS